MVEETIAQIEQSQKEMRSSIEATKDLTARSEQLIQRNRHKASGSKKSAR